MTPPPEKIVCDCLGVTEDKVVEAIESGRLYSVRQVRDCTGAGEGCTACHPAIRAYLTRLRRLRSVVPQLLGQVVLQPQLPDQA